MNVVQKLVALKAVDTALEVVAACGWCCVCRRN
jgi:hypothetical protein